MGQTQQTTWQAVGNNGEPDPVTPSVTVYSMLDLAITSPNDTIADALAATVPAAQAAEKSGYQRVWYAEHHNMPSIASSATSVLIAHVAAHTTTIRLGAGGVMLPNHSPLTIAEQYGTLAELHPGRIDLGLGRAPGGDLAMLAALRRTPGDAENFPTDIIELQSYLGDRLPTDAVNAYPGRGTNVPLYILGSSLFGAQLAARLGLPYAFASHFAPAALKQALTVYRDTFQPSTVLDAPYTITALNVIAGDDPAWAANEMRRTQRQRLRGFLKNRAADLSEADLDSILDSPHGDAIRDMMRYTAQGTVGQVRDYVRTFLDDTGADEIIVAHAVSDLDARLRSIDILAEALTN